MIPRSRKQIHVASEALAVVAVAPYLFWVSNQTGVAPNTRRMLRVIAAGTVLLDGYLLLQYLGDSK